MSKLPRLINVLKQPAVLAAVAVLILRGLTLASRFLLSILLARMLSPADMGGYGLITAVLAFALLAMGLEFYSYMYREMVPASPERRAQIIADQIALGGIAFLAVSFLSALAVFAGLFPARLVPWFLLILATEHLSLEATRFLIITSRPVRAYMGVFLRGGVWVYALTIVMLTVASSRTLGMVLVFWALGGVSSIVFAMVALRDLPWYRLRGRWPDWTWISAGLRTAQPFMLTATGALIITYFDRFVIDRYEGREALGIYTFYSTIAVGLLSLGASVSHQFLPKVIAGHAAGLDPYRKSLRSFLRSLFGVALAMTAFAGMSLFPILSMFGLGTYAKSIWVFYLMLPGVLLRTLADVPSYALYAARSDRTLMLCNAASAIASVLLNILIVPVAGIYGAALSNCIASGLLLITLTFFVLNYLRDCRKEADSAGALSVRQGPDKEIFLQ
jgi:O-antigen/teichoic acid export membrane protein